LHLAALTICIAGLLLLLLAERMIPVPGWLHLAAIILLAQAILMLWAALRRREERLGARLRGEISGLQRERAQGARLRDVSAQTATEKEIWQRNRELSILNNILIGVNRDPRLEDVLQETLVETLELFQAGAGTLHLFDQESAAPALAASHLVPSGLQELIIRDLEERSARVAEVTLPGAPAAPGLAASVAGKGWGGLTAVPLAAQGVTVGVMHLLHAVPRDYSKEELRFLESVGTQLGSAVGQTRLFAELNWKSAELLRSYRLLEGSSHSLGLSELQLKQNLALVEQANLDLSRLDRMKNQFLGMVSHEFNTPLTSILSGTEYLLQLGSGQENDQVLEMIRGGGLRLKELVADILKLIKLEAQGGELATSALHLDHSLKSLREQLQPQLTERGQTLRLTDLEALPYFDGDWKYLERVFSELLLNAMRFTPVGGEIEVTGRVVDRAALGARRETLERFSSGFLGRCGERCFLEVEVRDNGIGIPAGEEQGIFEIFYEVGDIRHHSSGSGGPRGKGAGLGLAIVKGMVEAHGGMV
jgi:signal transduction histidine kinase